ncbi:unnamed protein product, partial [Rotaria sp. Silwood1]
NRTQLGNFGNNSSMMKLFELIRSSYQLIKIWNQYSMYTRSNFF